MPWRIIRKRYCSFPDLILLFFRVDSFTGIAHLMFLIGICSSTFVVCRINFVGFLNLWMFCYTLNAFKDLALLLLNYLYWY